MMALDISDQYLENKVAEFDQSLCQINIDKI